jgi:hypothetical protein
VAIKENLAIAKRWRFGMGSVDSIWFACTPKFRNRFGNCWLDFSDFVSCNFRPQLSPLLSLGKTFMRACIGKGDLEMSFPVLVGIGVAWVDRDDNIGFVKERKVGEAFPTFAEIEAGYCSRPTSL